MQIGGAELAVTPDAEMPITTRISIFMVPDDGKGEAPTLDDAQKFLIETLGESSPAGGGGSMKLQSTVDFQLDHQPARKLMLGGPNPAGVDATVEIVCSVHKRNLYGLVIASPKDKIEKYQTAFQDMVGSFRFVDALSDYASQKYPFQFKYPSYWSIYPSKDPDELMFTPAAQDKNPVVTVSVPSTGKSEQVSLEETERQITADLTKRIPNATVESKPLNIGGAPAHHVQVQSSDPSADKFDFYLCDHNKMIIFFCLQGSSQPVDEVTDQFDGMISSVRFTDVP